MKTIFADSFFGLINKSLYFGLRILIIFIFSKEASTDSFGSFVYILNLVEISRLILDFGIDTTYNGVFGRMPKDEVKAKIESIFSLKIVSSLMASGVITAGCYLTGISENVWLITVTSLILPFMAVNSFINIYFQSGNNNKALFKNYILAFLISVTCIYFLNKILESYFIYLIVELIFFVFIFIRIYRTFGIRFKLFSIRHYLAVYRSSFYAGGNQVFVTLYYKTDLLFIKKLSSAINVASYGFFMRIMDPLIMIASALATSAYSFFSRHIPISDKKQMALKLRQYLFVTLFYAVLIITAITFLLPPALVFLKSKYLLPLPLACLFGLATSIRILSAALSSIQYSLGQFKFTFKLSLMSIGILLPLYFILIPHFNISGVLIAVVASEFISVVIKLHSLRKFLF